MARIPGVEPENAGFLVRLAYWFTKRKIGRVIMPVRIHAHHPRLLRGLGSMEMAQQAAQAVAPSFKGLINIRVAMRIGCPF